MFFDMVSALSQHLPSTRPRSIDAGAAAAGTPSVRYPGMAAIFAGNCLACTVPAGVITWKRRRHRSEACQGHQTGWHPPTQRRRAG